MNAVLWAIFSHHIVISNWSRSKVYGRTHTISDFKTRQWDRARCIAEMYCHPIADPLFSHSHWVNLSNLRFNLIFTRPFFRWRHHGMDGKIEQFDHIEDFMWVALRKFPKWQTVNKPMRKVADNTSFDLTIDSAKVFNRYRYIGNFSTVERMEDWKRHFSSV